MSKKSNKGIIALLIVILLAVLFVGGYYVYGKINADIKGNPDDKTEYTLIIEKSDFQYDVSQKLYNNGIVINDSVWSSWMDKHYPDFKYINGEYLLTAGMSYEEIAEKLQNPDVSHTTIKVVIPEGYNVFDIAKTLENNNICSSVSFLEACKTKDPYEDSFTFLKDFPESNTVAYELEGFLFPATYDFGENSDAADVVKEMLGAFSSRLDSSWTDYCSKNNMTLYELVTLASVVEKETLGQGVAQDIASVFVNRLNSSTQLQSDVTIDYGNALREAGFSDEIVTSYNTYKCSALPSGPICNPGISNIDAVVNHNDTGYMFFFSYNNGSDFYFTDSYNDFSSQWEKLKDTNTNG